MEENKRSSAELSDFLESTFFGRDFGDTVVVERSVAAMFQYQMKGLEEENEKLRRGIKILKIILVGAALIMFTLILMLLKIL